VFLSSQNVYPKQNLDPFRQTDIMTDRLRYTLTNADATGSSVAIVCHIKNSGATSVTPWSIQHVQLNINVMEFVEFERRLS